MNPIEERKPLPDILKGFTILLVILGHCIQEGSGVDFHENTLYFYDRLYQFLYSFHMPLFMLISGYFAWGSMERATGKSERVALLKRRSLTLFLPVFSWTVFDQSKMLVEHYQYHHAFPSLPAFVRSFALGFLSTGWFLWAVFWCFLIVYILHFFFRDSVFLYGIGFLAMFVVPDGLGLGAYKFMFPYFIAGFYFHRYYRQKTSPISSRIRNSWLWTAALGISFAILFLFFDENSMIYLSGYKLIGSDIPRQLKIDLYRTAIGFSGSCFFLLLWKNIVSLAGTYHFPVLRALGRNSLGLYMISGEICLIAGQRLRPFLHPNYLLNLAEAVIVAVLAYILTIICGKLPVLCWLIGKKRSSR